MTKQQIDTLNALKFYTYIERYLWKKNKIK
jgi:hypothetical protein